MAKDVDKVKTKAKMNWGWDRPEDRDGKATRTTKTSSSKRAQKRTQKSVEKKIRRGLGVKGILIVLLVMIMGIGVGVGAFYFVGRNDCFELIGEDYVVLELGEKYIDQGVKVISLGKDISSKVVVETDGLIDNGDGSFSATSADRYAIIYKSNDIKYGKLFTVQRIRFIDFVEPIEDDRINMDDAGGASVGLGDI